MVRQDVHIIPVGQEYDRVVLPFLPDGRTPAQLFAHRIILLVTSDPLSRRTASKIRRALTPVTVIETVDLEPERPTRSGSFRDVLQEVSRVCVRELEAGNRVHINLSSGPKIVAFAVGLAGMAHLRPGHGSVYHVRPAGHSVTEDEFERHGRTKGMLQVDEVELVPVLLPDPLQLRLLGHLRTQEEESADYREILEFLSRIPGSEYSLPEGAHARSLRDWNALTTKMVRKVLSPLEEKGLIEIQNRGRHRGARLTGRGAMYAALAAPEPRGLLKPLGVFTRDGDSGASA